MKLLLISQYYPPESGSCPVHMGEMADYFSRKGHPVTVLTGFPNYPDGKLYDGYRRSFIKRERKGRINIVRTFLFITQKRLSFVPRLLNYLSFMLTAIPGGLLTGKHDLIYFYSPSLFQGVSAAVLGRIWRAPVIMELNDLWPRSAISLGIVKKGLPIRIAEALERYVYKHSTKIFAYSRLMREEIIKAGVAEDKVEIHNLWIDSELYKSPSTEAAQRIRDKYGLNGKFVVMYTGIVGMAQGLEILVYAGELIKQRELEDIVIVIVGSGPERQNLINLANEKGLDNLLFIDQQPRERMAAFMSATDVLVSHLRASPHRVGTIPAKILSYMAAGKPVIAGAVGEAANLIERYNCGIAVPPDDPEAMADGIQRIKEEDREHLNQMSLSGSQAIDREFERKIVLEKLEERLCELAS